MTKPKCKVTKTKGCEDGNHQFIVSNWSFDANKQKANGFTCQFCLISVDGVFDVDKLRNEVHARGNPKQETSKDL